MEMRRSASAGFAQDQNAEQHRPQRANAGPDRIGGAERQLCEAPRPRSSRLAHHRRRPSGAMARGA